MRGGAAEFGFVGLRRFSMFSFMVGCLFGDFAGDCFLACVDCLINYCFIVAGIVLLFCILLVALLLFGWWAYL